MTSAPASSISTTRHTYGSDPEQFGDLYLPTGSGPLPTLVYVHGGGYRAAVTLAGAAGMCAALASHGYAVWSIEYRRVGNGGGWPTTFDDARAAAAYLETLASDAPIDLHRVAVGGQSAGGQLALWLASNSARNQAALPSFRGVVALAPATDLRRSANNDPGAPIPEVLGGSPDDVSERYAAVSPIELAPIGLPQLVVHGTADRIVPFAMSEAYVATARGRGDAVDFVSIDGADHLDLWNPASTVFARVVASANEFIARTVAQEP